MSRSAGLARARGRVDVLADADRDRRPRVAREPSAQDPVLVSRRWAVDHDCRRGCTRVRAAGCELLVWVEADHRPRGRYRHRTAVDPRRLAAASKEPSRVEEGAGAGRDAWGERDSFEIAERSSHRARGRERGAGGIRRRRRARHRAEHVSDRGTEGHCTAGRRRRDQGGRDRRLLRDHVRVRRGADRRVPVRTRADDPIGGPVQCLARSEQPASGGLCARRRRSLSDDSRDSFNSAETGRCGRLHHGEPGVETSTFEGRAPLEGGLRAGVPVRAPRGR